MLKVLSLAQAWIAIGEGARTSTLGESLTISGEFRPEMAECGRWHQALSACASELQSVTGGTTSIHQRWGDIIAGVIAE